MLRRCYLYLFLGLLAGCDTQEERPLTLAERVAGTWVLDGIRDGDLVVTRRFTKMTGAVQLELQSVGCCAGSAGYRFTVIRPDGEVIETVAIYAANDVPTDGDDFIVLLSNDEPIALSLAYDFNTSFTKMTLTGLDEVSDAIESLALLGVDFPFREQPVFRFDKLE